MDQQFLDLYHRHVAAAFDRQLRFADFLARKAPGEPWAFDTETAALTFGPKVSFEAPIVGSHADHNDSWMWSWANRNLRLSLTNRALGDTIRALAHKAMVGEFARPAFPLEPLVGPDLLQHAPHAFGAVLAGELGYDAYNHAPYDGGRALLLIRDDRLRFAERHPLARVLTVFPQAIGAFPVPDHQAALSEYARSYGLHANPEAGALKITGEGSGSLTATFDDRGRLANLEGTGVTMPKPRPTTPVKKEAAKPVKKAAKPAAKTGAKKPAAASAKKTTKKPVAAAAKKKAAPKAKASTAVARKPAKKAAKPVPKKKPAKKR
jgi:hypothetical protein